MSRDESRIVSRTFFLNEQHELVRGEKASRDEPPQFPRVDWTQHAVRLSQSLNAVAVKLDASKDPLRRMHCFLLVVTVDQGRPSFKKNSSKPMIADPSGSAGDRAHQLRGLGLDLITFSHDTRVLVHATYERFEQLKSQTASLAELGTRDQSRWSTIASFEIIPVEMRMDLKWWRSLEPEGTADVVIELQPLLTRADAERVLRGISDLLLDKASERLTGTGADLSGRHWLRGTLSPKSLSEVANEFFSVQSLHPPLYSAAQ